MIHRMMSKCTASMRQQDRLTHITGACDSALVRRWLLATFFALTLVQSVFAATIQTVDDGTGGPVGEYASMAVVAGNPAVAYYNVADRDLRFNRNSNPDGSGIWNITTVDSVGDVGAGASLAIVDGNPAIAYRDATNGHLKFARNSAANGSGTWAIHTIDNSGTVGDAISLVFLASSQPAIAYYDQVNQDLKFARAGNAAGTGTWTISTVSSTGNVGLGAAMVVLANGRPAIAAERQGGGLIFLRNAVNDGSGAWTESTVTTTTVGTLSLALVAGNPAIAFSVNVFQTNLWRVQYIRNSTADGAGAWNAIGDTTVETGISTAFSLADVAGLPAVAVGGRFARGGSVNGTAPWTQFAVMTFNGNNFASLRIIDGNPAVSVYSQAGDLYYSRDSTTTGSGTWSAQVIDDGSTASGGDVGTQATLALISGNPGIAYYDLLNSDLKFARNAASDGSGAWAISSPLSNGEVGDFSRLAVVAGNPAIAFYNATTDNVMFTRNASATGSGSWTSSNVETTTETGGISILEVSSAPALTYMARTASVARLRFARNSAATGSGAWTTATVDTLVANSTSANAYFSSLGIVDGRPSVAYYHNDDTSLRFARNSAADGSGAWTVTTVDNTANVGQFVSLAVVANTPAISYYDVTNTALKFARNSAIDGNGTWIVVTVDNTGNTGEFTSLAVINGLPAISYYDRSNGDLKLAQNSAADGSGTWTITTIDSATDVGRHTSLKPLVGGYGIAYRGITDTSLKFAYELSCAGISFPYTLVAGTQSELVNAIQCANANGASSDTINLNGLNVPLLAATPFGDYVGRTALPQITTNIVIRNGTLRHDASGGGFLNRTFSVASTGTLNLERVVLDGDEGPSPGGAIHNSGTINITNCTFTGYRTSNRAGVLHNGSGATVNIANALFYSNLAVFGHAIDSAGTVNIVNSTFDKHTSVSNFGAVLEGAGYTVRNSIIWNPNSSPTSIASGNSVSNSIVKGGYAGGTNILSVDPLFVDRTGDNFRLQASSPALDIGVNADVPLDTTDIDNDGNTTEPRPDRDLNPRIVGAQVDLGAYELQSIPPTLSINDVSQNEGNTGTTTFTFTVSLSAPAGTGGVGFAIATANGTASSASDYVAQSLTGQTIPAGSSTYQFSVQVNGDAVSESNETFNVNVSSVTGATVADGQGVGTIQNDDVVGITATPTSGLVTTEAGGTASFTVRLNSQPTASVSIFLIALDTSEGAVAPSSLTFTTANWNTVQTVTVTGVDDAIVDGTVTYLIVADPVSSDIGYNQLNPIDVSVSNLDNDSVGITVTPTSGLVTTEAGGTDTFTVRLNSQPTANVTIGLSSSDATEGTVAPSSLIFTTANWNTAQTVTVTGVDDAIVDGTVAYSIITAAATSSDTSYNGLNASDVSVSNTDNDTAGITVTPTSGLTTTEAGGSDTFTVRLNSQPTANVTIGLSSSDTTEGTVGPISLTFTTANWNTAQTVTVTGVDDAIVDGTVAYSIITAPAASSDTNYNGLNASDVSVSNTDNDAVGITVLPTSGLTTTEAGGTDTFTVRLNSQPTANVTIGLSSSDTSEGTVAPMSLIFTTANWNTAQTVTVTGVDDAIVDGTVAYSIITAPAASSDTNYNGLNASDVSVSNTDNDAAGVTVTPTSGLTTTEAGGTDTFTVRLNSQPTANVTIGLSSSDTSEGTVAPISLIFTTANWNTAQTVTVAGVDDAIVDGTVAYSIVTAAASSSDTNYNGLNASDVGVSNTDNDSAGITVTPTSGLTTTEAGGADTFTVRLNSQPTADVTIALSSSDATEGTVGPNSLTFTTANWNTAQTVTVTGVDDLIVDGTVGYSIITAPAASSDTNYNGLNASDVGVSNTDNDAAGVTVTPTSGLITTEAGGTDTFTVRLNSQPTANVTIGLSSSDTSEGTVAPISLIFTTANWNTAQTVTVTGVDDAIVDGTVAYSIITAPAASSDTNYNGLNASDVSVSNTDNDAAGVTVTPTSGLTTTEAGGTDTFTVRLNSQPTANVTIGLSSSDTSEGTVGPISLTFTTANWNTAQSVTVTGVDDAIVDGTVAYSVITAPAASSDTNYNGLNASDVGVSNTDNDAVGITVTPTSGLTTTEAGGTDTFTVRLNSQPTANVTIGLSSSDTSEGTVAPSSLIFTTANWNTAQTVTVTGVDDAIVDGTVAYSIVTAAASSSDTNYNGLNASDVSVSNTDNDSAGVTVTPTSGLTTTEAGGADTFTVRLNSQPTADVTIALSSSDATEGTVGPNSLTFTTANWNTAQTVTVTGVDDLIVDGTVGYSIITAPAASSDTSYNGLNASDVSVSNTDNDTVGIAVTPTSGLTTTEGGGTDTFTVRLNSQPTANVTIGLSSSDTSEGTVAPISLIFTTANWNTAQTVTVTGVDDAIVDGTVAYSIITAAASSSDTNYNGLNASDVGVSNTDNDSAGITVTPTSGLTTTEAGGADTFTVRLNSQPTADVTIALSSSDATEGTVGPNSLTFTTANWNTAQTVTVTGVDDLIVDGTVGYSIITAPAASSDTNYSGLNASDVSVSNTDNDSAGITVTPTSGLTTTEAGGTDTFTVRLNSQPTADVTIGLSSSDTSEGTVAPISLIFTTANWNTAQMVTVTGVDDTIVDATVAYSIVTAAATSSDTNYNGLNPSDVSASNTDDDTATVQFAPASISQSEGIGAMLFTVTLTRPVQSGVTLTVNSTAGTASSADFAAITNATVSFPPASTESQTVSVAINNDALDEDNEQFTLTLSGLTATGVVTLGTAVATGTIQDNDETPTLSVANVTQAEGNASNTLTFVATLSAISGRPVSFTRATQDGTATSVAPDIDFVPLTAAGVSIPAGTMSVPIVVTINGDTTFEGDQGFALNLTDIVNAIPGSLTASAILTDDDQQPTITSINSDLPDPSLVGQPYLVLFTVSGQSSSPAGTVTVSDGAVSCTATLAAGTAPNSNASCQLISVTAGAKTLTASFTPASTAFAASSDTETHQVNAASTTLSVTGPARVGINTPATYTIGLGVVAPGGGTPTGTVTLSDGSINCTIVLPASSCNLTFASFGSRTITAIYAGNANYIGSSSSATTVVSASSDLQVTKSNGDAYYESGDLLVYTIQLRNAGPDSASNVRLIDIVPTSLTGVQWSCDAAGGAVCPRNAGSGNLDETVVILPTATGLLNYTLFGTVAASPNEISNTASVQLPPDATIADPVPSNNSATDVDQLNTLFRNGFEGASVNAPSGSFVLPSAALRSALDSVALSVFRLDDEQGGALRIYARVFNGELEYALATRGSDGRMRLGAWQRFASEPTLRWTATRQGDGWVLQGATLQ